MTLTRRPEYENLLRSHHRPLESFLRAPECLRRRQALGASLLLASPQLSLPPSRRSRSHRLPVSARYWCEGCQFVASRFGQRQKRL